MNEYKTMKKTNIIQIAYSVLLCAFSFIYYLINANSYPLIYITIILMGFQVLKRKKIYMDREAMCWAISSVFILISSVISPDSAAIQYGITFIAFIFFFINLRIVKHGWKTSFIICVGLFSTIHVLATILQFFQPIIINEFNKSVLPLTSYEENKRLFTSFGAYAGITGQTGRNGWYISVALGFWIIQFLTSKKHKFLCLAMNILCVIALLLTHKRTFLVIPLIIILCILLLRGNINLKKALKIIIIGSCVFLLFKILVAHIPELAFTLQRFNGGDVQDLTTGRMDLWLESFDIFKHNSLLGVGIFNTRNILGGNWSHNIYIQLLAEIGIIGTLVVVFTMLTSLRLRIKVNKKLDKLEEKQNLFSIYYQLLFLLYGFTGNPFFEIQVVGFYIISIALGSRRQYIR